MKLVSIILAMSLFATGTATAAALTAEGPGSLVDCAKYIVVQFVNNRPIEPCAVENTSAQSVSAGCDNGALKDPVVCAVWAVKCIGDALGGHACTRLA